MSDVHIDKVSKWSKAFVRQNAYLLTDEQRYASIKHGAISTLIDPANLIKTLVASWSYKLIARGDNLLFKPNWFDEYSTIFATPGTDDNIGNIYEYVDGDLKFYDQDQYSNLIETRMVGKPNTFEQGSPIPYPHLNQLKRIHISNPKISPI